MHPRIDILVNATYEAFDVSEEARACKEGSTLPTECIGHHLEHRMNPNHVYYRHLHGAIAASGPRCRIEVESVPVVLLDFVSLHSDEGLDEIYIDFGGAYRELCLHYTNETSALFGAMIHELSEFEAEWNVRQHISLRNAIEMY